MRTLCGALVFRSHEWHDALVDLDSGDDAALVEELHQRGAVSRLLVQGLLVQDDAGNVLGDGVVGSEEQLAVVAAGLLLVLHADILQALAHCAWREEQNISIYST